jgi:hypothetical protein
MAAKVVPVPETTYQKTSASKYHTPDYEHWGALYEVPAVELRELETMVCSVRTFERIPLTQLLSSIISLDCDPPKQGRNVYACHGLDECLLPEGTFGQV